MGARDRISFRGVRGLAWEVFRRRWWLLAALYLELSRLASGAPERMAETFD